jgi:uridylate kinase
MNMYVVKRDGKKEKVSFDKVLEKNLKVMDGTAIAQCRDNKMPIIVFKLMEKNNIKDVVCGKDIGTKVI